MSNNEQARPVLTYAAYHVLRLVCERAGVYRCLEVVPERVAGELGLEAWEVEEALRELDRLELLHLTGVAGLVMVPVRSLKLLPELEEPERDQPRLRLAG